VRRVSEPADAVPVAPVPSPDAATQTYTLADELLRAIMAVESSGATVEVLSTREIRVRSRGACTTISSQIDGRWMLTTTWSETRKGSS
jgi:hypothetical protein